MHDVRLLRRGHVHLRRMQRDGEHCLRKLRGELLQRIGECSNVRAVPVDVHLPDGNAYRTGLMFLRKRIRLGKYYT